MSRVSLGDDGVTLLETVVSMMILFAVLSVIPLAISSMNPPNADRSHNEHEMYIWFQQLQREAKYTREHIIENQHRLTMVDIEDKKRTIRMRQGQLIQQVDGLGHTILLYNIESFRVVSHPRGVKISIGANGREYDQVIGTTLAPEGEFISVKREP